MAVFCINIHFLKQMTTKSSKIVKKLRNCVISNQISKDKIYASIFIYNYSFKSMSKIKDNAKPYFIEYNVTENDKMNVTKNNERQ